MGRSAFRAGCVVATEPGALLEQRYGVRVERVAPSRDQSIGAWRGGPPVHQSGALQLAHVVAAMAILAYLVVGPTPWRADRWAWFWMTSVSPLASVAFLLLSGPTPGIRPPADPSRRMNGWWGFLIAFLLPGITAGLAMTASGFLDSLYF
ncbi:hypothetical protein GCM10027425_24690 [Alteromonas gracilis]